MLSALRYTAAAAALLLAGLMTTAPGCRKNPATDKQASAPQIVTTPLGVEMLLLPAGWFEMGSVDGQPNERPVHRVWLDSFLIDRTEVTQDQFRRLEIPDPSHFKGPTRPVEQVTITEVIEFCNERSLAEGLKPAYIVIDEGRTWRCDFSADGYRLPTEAEWEYACQAGSAGSGNRKSLPQQGWFADNAGKTTHPVARKRPNRWGLFDMYGNVAEWCNDYYEEDYYADSPQRNPRGPVVAELLVLRGGGWNSPADHFRPTWRAGESPKFHDICFAKDTIGFRCVRPAPTTNQALVKSTR